MRSVSLKTPRVDGAADRTYTQSIRRAHQKSHSRQQRNKQTIHTIWSRCEKTDRRTHGVMSERPSGRKEEKIYITFFVVINDPLPFSQPHSLMPCSILTGTVVFVWVCRVYLGAHWGVQAYTNTIMEIE